MPVMRNTVHRPGTADPVAGATVQIRLVASTSDPSAPGYLGAAKVTVLGRWRTETNAAGVWERDLPATSSITPAGTVYELVEVDGTPGARSTPRHFTVPDAPGSHWVGDHLTDPPAAVESPALANHRLKAGAEAHAGLVVTPQHSTTLGTTSIGAAGLIEVSYTSQWGIDAGGLPYFDADGAAMGEEAVLIVESDGSLALVQPQEV